MPAGALVRDPEARITTGGAFRLAGDALLFCPRHPFAAGTAYAFLARESGEVVRFTRPRQVNAPSTVVREIYPTTAALPVNALRFYVQFSASMSEGFAAGAVRLCDGETGVVLDDALLPMTPELWDPARTRLTLLLDPGRIKRGLVPHDEAGYPLRDGRTVELRVSTEFLDAAGVRLAGEASRRYTVRGALRGRLDPNRWTIDPLVRWTRSPVRVRFGRPVDHALALRCLTITCAGRAVAGVSRLAPGEREWTFTPAARWDSAGHTLRVAPELEDIAGNSVTRVFDRDLDDPADDPAPACPVDVDLDMRTPRPQPAPRAD